MGINDGHLERLRQRYMKVGLDGFDDLSVLELLLCFAIPRRDTNPIAHALLDRFGSLSSVLEAKPEELQQVDGVGESAAVLLTMFPGVSRKILVQRSRTAQPLDSTSRLGAYFVPRFAGERDEVVLLLCLDAQLHPLDCRPLFRGSVNTASVSVRKTLQMALACNASAVVLAHNHPGGRPMPSVEDEQTTCRLRAALDSVEIPLLDHIIVADDQYFSFAEHNFTL